MYIMAFLIGVVAGLRAMTPLAAVSWAAHLGWLHLENTPFGFLGSVYAAYISTFLAVGELINDKLPKTPSRKIPPAFAARVVVGSVAGAALGMPSGNWIAGLIIGSIGAVVGTLGGYEFRSRLVRATGGKDLPIALLEDVIAVGSAFWVVSR